MNTDKIYAEHIANEYSAKKESKVIALGIAIGIFGLIGVSTNYFAYKKILTNSKAKYAQDIIRLANEIAESKN